MSQVRVEIGGVGFLFRHKNLQIKEDKNKTLDIRDFIQPGRNDFIIDVEVARLPEYPRDRSLFEARENWRSYIYKGDYIFETYQSPENEGSKKVTQICFMKKDLPRAKVYISPEAETAHEGLNIKNKRTWSLERLMQITGQLISISVLHRYQGLHIHSSGIILDGEGVIFPGISGVGKTTLAKLWQERDEVTVLSDDRVIVRREKEGYFVYGTPWPGEGRAISCQKAPLRKILFLSKSKENRLIPLGKRESLFQLITQCFPAIWDREGIDFSLKFCGALVEDIPCFSFGFVPDKTATSFVEEKFSV
ncbi:MAG: hypothetical protein ISS34_07595 [Candidatus Omnitrophica bacterium]|nr:hypothetical protein [Candidatus Omnitrophota bacterium]